MKDNSVTYNSNSFGSSYRATFRLSPGKVLYTISNDLYSTISHLHVIINTYYELKIHVISDVNVVLDRAIIYILQLRGVPF